MPCVVAIVDCTYAHYVVHYKKKNQHKLYLIAVVDWTHVEVAIVSFKDLVRVAQENCSSNQIPDVLVEEN